MSKSRAERSVRAHLPGDVDGRLSDVRFPDNVVE